MLLLIFGYNKGENKSKYAKFDWNISARVRAGRRILKGTLERGFLKKEQGIPPFLIIYEQRKRTETFGMWIAISGSHLESQEAPII